jgi:uncharacterized protein (DUF1330 family)
VAVALCVLLWAAPGQQERLVESEDQVLELLADHDARVLIRVRAIEGDPTEVQVLEFPTEAALQAFQSDPRRLALADLRALAIERTEILRVGIVADESGD